MLKIWNTWILKKKKLCFFKIRLLNNDIMLNKIELRNVNLIYKKAIYT